MLNPPLLSWIGPFNESPIPTNGVQISPTNPVFRFSGAKVGVWGDSYPRDLFYMSAGITGLYAQLPFRAEFDTDAQELNIYTLGNGGVYRLRINEEYVGLPMAEGPQPNGNFYWLRLTFPTADRRAIRMESWGQAFGGLAMSSADHVYRPSKSLGPRCVVLGDSYAEGLLCFAQRLADLMGWEVWSSGVGGTGYLNPGPTGRVKFRDRVQSDVINRNPDIVIIAGGLNDSSYLPASVQAEAQALYDTVSTNLPSTKLVVVGPWFPSGQPPQSILDVRDALQAAALSRHLDFVDPLRATNAQQFNAGWITGSGNIANPTGDGNADNYISEDGTHPTDLGHQYLATKLAVPLRAITLADPTPNLSVQILVGLQVSGKVGRQYLIQRSSDSGSNWIDEATVTLQSSPQLWVDTTPANATKRFYRALLLP